MAFSASFAEKQRLISLACLSFVLVVFAALAGCERSGPPASQPLSQQKNGGSESKSDAHSKSSQSVRPVDSAKTAALADKQITCSYDAQCTGYFRCIDEVCAVPPAITGAHDETTPVVVFRDEKSPDSKEISRFYVELAISNLEQQRGLMFRRSMQPNWGMLFIYPYEEHHAFWMKNTLIPLDMVFVNASGQVVGVVEGAEPLTLNRREVDGVSRYILELNAGVAEKSGIKTGVWMGFENIAEEHEPRL